jgi:undecaprenyl-diphosphatase
MYECLSGVQIRGKKIQLRGLRTLLAISLVFLVCFLLLAVFRSGFASLNLSVNIWAASINNNGSFTILAKGLSLIFDTTALAIMSVAVASILLAKNYKRYSLLLLSSMLGDAILVLAFKTLIMSQRPLNEIILETGYSFPSGHVTGCVVFFGVLTYFAWKRWTTLNAKIVTSGLYIAITVVVAFDRIYLNVHWLSDTIGGVFLGAFWLLLCFFVFEYLALNQRFKTLTKV